MHRPRTLAERGQGPGRFRRRWGVVPAALAGGLAVAPPAQGLSLEEALALAASHPGVRAAQEAAQADYAAVAAAGAAWFPTVHGFASAGVAHGWLDTTAIQEGDHSGASTSGQIRLGLAYQHNLYRGGSDTATLRRARLVARQGIAAAQDVHQGVLLRVATTYLNAVLATRTVALREAALAAFEERARDARVRFEVGAYTRSDVALAEAERAVAATAILSARAELAIETSLLAKLVGTAPGALETDTDLAASLLPPTLAGARRAAEDLQPAVRAAAHALRAAEHAMHAVAGEAGASVDLVGSMSVTGRHDRGQRFFLPGSPLTDPDSASTERRTDVRAGIRLRVPIYQAGRQKARMEQAKRIYRQRREEWMAIRLEAAQQAESAWHNLQAARARSTAAAATVAASETALIHVRNEANAGTRSLRDVLDAQRVLVERRIEALQADRDRIVEGFRLLAAVGDLTLRNLQQP